MKPGKILGVLCAVGVFMAMGTTVAHGKSRSPSSVSVHGSCITAPTIECVPGYEVQSVRETIEGKEKTCFECVQTEVKVNFCNRFPSACFNAGATAPTEMHTEGDLCAPPTTLTCKTGWVVADEGGCGVCTMPHLHSPSCVTGPPATTITCVSGFHPAADHQGCGHCVAN